MEADHRGRPRQTDYEEQDALLEFLAALRSRKDPDLLPSSEEEEEEEKVWQRDWVCEGGRLWTNLKTFGAVTREEMWDGNPAGDGGWTNLNARASPLRV